MKIAILLFPGTNRATDIANAIMHFSPKAEIVFVKPQTTNLAQFKLIILPGGFSYGDVDGYGTKAAQQPVITALNKAITKGVPTIGICNGFQILTSCGFLPGKLTSNNNKRFVAIMSSLRISNKDNLFMQNYAKDESIKLPVAHYAGNYQIDNAGLQELNNNKQIILQYNSNINGSNNHIAAISNKEGNVLGIMPHPENACLPYHASHDGANFIKAIIKC